MPDVLELLRNKLSTVGYEGHVSALLLNPGPERTSLMTLLLSKLSKPASLEALLQKLPEDDRALNSCSAEERAAYRYACLLDIFGIYATPELVRGCVSPQESLKFLHTLLDKVMPLERRQQAADAGRAVGEGAEAKMLSFAAQNLSSLASDSISLFTTDISKAVQPHLSQANQLLKNGPALCRELHERMQQLQQQVDARSQQMELVDDAKWRGAQQEVQMSIHSFLHAMEGFMRVYNQDLGVWCESLTMPETCGLGPKAAAMRQTYARLQVVLDSMAHIRNMHAALTTSAPPLQMYQPQTLLQIAAQGQLEVERLRQDIQRLARARQHARDQGSKALLGLTQLQEPPEMLALEGPQHQRGF